MSGSELAPSGTYGGSTVTVDGTASPPDPSPAPCAALLKETANDPRYVLRRADLLSLAAAIESSDGDLAGWDSLDLFESFSPESTIQLPPSRHSLVESVFGVLAAIAVFLPVGWTWFSMFRAAVAYRAMLKSGQGDGASFLQLWIDGFDDRLRPIHQLDAVAMVSLLLIVFAVAMIVIQRTIARVGARQDGRDFLAAVSSLNEAITLAARTMSVGSMSESQGHEAMIKRSVRALNRAHLATARAAEDLQSAAKAATRTLNDSLAQLQPILTEIKGSTGAMANAAQAMKSSAAVSSAATYSLDCSTKILASSSNDLTRNVKALVDAELSLPASFGTAVQQSIADLDKSVEQMSENLGAINVALAGNQSATQAQVTELTQARNALELMLRQINDLVDALTEHRAA